MSNALERTDGKPSLRQMIEQMKPQIERALPRHLDPDRVARIAITVLGTNPKFQDCTPESFLGALMTASQLGLEPGPLGEAYLVPYGRQVTFIAGYRGLIKLAYQSGELKRIDAHVIREHDEFDFAYGLEPYLRHKPPLGDRGKVIGAYASAILNNGEAPFVVLSRDEVERHRKRSRAADNGPWVTDWDAMARKTAVRRLARWLPMSTELRNFGLAVGLDGSTRTEIDRRVDELPYDEPAALEPATRPVSMDDLPRPVAAEAVPDQADDYQHWHETGHQTGESPARQAFDPGCDICTVADQADAGRAHYYNHSVDFVDGCEWCDQDKAWKEEGGG